MGFPFVRVSELLELLEANAAVSPRVKSDVSIIWQWFVCHRTDLDRKDVDLCCLAATLLPARRPDRVYAIQARSLCAIAARALGLGVSRIHQLKRYELPGSDRDLAECVEAILRETPNAIDPKRPVTVEEIDAVLHAIAAKCRFSSPAVRASSRSSPKARDVHAPLQALYRRLEPTAAKWFTRLVLKDFYPVKIDPHVFLRHLDPVLPALAKIYDDLPTVIDSLKRVKEARRLAGGQPNSADVARQFSPMLGVKVARQPWLKGRSIKHCLQMGHGRMSVEKKLDGEYCQIHVDLSKGGNCIQIFSKSGKDSTMDRVGLQPAIKASLSLGAEGCRLRKGCILEGELVVYSDKDAKILPFEKIRKHVSRSGSFFHKSALDSQTHPWEKLMIVYYDVLMIDDESLLGSRHSERFRRLGELVTTAKGVAELVQREVIDFDWHLAASTLRRAFARCIAAREEGLVLKADDPYFDFDGKRRACGCSPIKLKKEYVGGFGDVGDFAVVGARYDPVKSKSYNVPGLKWTHFYVGCLSNREEMLRCDERPQFTVTNVVELNATQLEYFRVYVNPEGVDPDANDTTTLVFAPGIDEGRRPSVVFPMPPVFDLRCFSFSRDANVGHYTLRFPMVSKVHCDRTWRDTIEFKELQLRAQEAREATKPDDSQEMARWIARLEGADPGGIAVDATSQQSGCSRETTSQESVSSAGACPTAAAPWPPTIPQCPHPAQTASRAGGGKVGSSDETRTPSTAQLLVNAATVIDLTRSPPRSPWKRARQDGHSRDTTAAAARPGSKLRRLSKSGDTSTGSSPSTQPPRSSPSVSRREPLEDMTAASSDRDNSQSLGRNPSGKVSSFCRRVSSQPVPPLESPSGAAQTRAECSRPTIASVGSSHAAVGPDGDTTTGYAHSDEDDGHVKAAANDRCVYHGQDCTLTSSIFLLAPCIAQFPWVTEDLLRGHGVHSFETDIKRWQQLLSSAPAINDDGSGTVRRCGAAGGGRAVGRNCGPSARPRRLMVLVEAGRKEATASFISQLEALGQEREATGGRRESAGVFDWRILQDIAEQERRTTTGPGGKRTGPRVDTKTYHQLWRGHFVGPCRV